MSLLVLGGGLLFFYLKHTAVNSKSNSYQTSKPEVANISPSVVIHTSLLGISSSGKPYHCNTSYSDEDGSGNGSLYTPGDGTGKLTLEVISDPNNNGESNTLLLGDKLYNWSTSGKGDMGYVFDKSLVKLKTSGTLIANTSSIPAKDFALKCTSWVVDKNILTIPKSVNFTDLSSTQ